MLFGGVNGITSFRPETLIDNPYAPKPVINKLFVHNKEVLPDDETGILKESITYVNRINFIFISEFIRHFFCRFQLYSG